jgi:hypothetical protein
VPAVVVVASLVELLVLLVSLSEESLVEAVVAPVELSSPEHAVITKRAERAVIGQKERVTRSIRAF